MRPDRPSARSPRTSCGRRRRRRHRDIGTYAAKTDFVWQEEEEEEEGATGAASQDT